MYTFDYITRRITSIYNECSSVVLKDEKINRGNKLIKKKKRKPKIK